jgi:hypothetical protein
LPRFFRRSSSHLTVRLWSSQHTETNSSRSFVDAHCFLMHGQLATCDRSSSSGRTQCTRLEQRSSAHTHTQLVMTRILHTYPIIYLLFYSLLSSRLHREPFPSLLFYRVASPTNGRFADRLPRSLPLR